MSDNISTSLTLEQHAVRIMGVLNADRKSETKFCDGILRSNGSDFSIHKCIVGAVSEMCKLMFLTEMKEAKQKAVEISIPDHILERVLDFIYTGTIELSSENVIDMLEAAEYLNILGLKDRCEDFMSNAVDCENCLKLRAFANRYSLNKLRSQTDQLIVDRFTDVLRSDDFQCLDVEDVLAILNKRRRQVKSAEYYTFASIVRWVKHDYDKRLDVFGRLFALIDFTSIPNDIITSRVRSEPMVSTNCECLKILIAGLCKKLSQQSVSTSANFTNYVTTTTKMTETDMLWERRSFIEECQPRSELLRVSRSFFRFIGDCIMIIGGLESQSSCVLYNIRTLERQQLPDLQGKRISAAAVRLDNDIYVMGGTTAKWWGNLRSVEKMNFHNRIAWKSDGEMQQAKNTSSAAVLNGCAYVTGGVNRCGEADSTCEVFDPDLKEWRAICNMLYARVYHGLVSMHGFLFSIGGAGERGLSSVEKYDPTIDKWTEVAPLNVSRRNMAVVSLNGYIYAIGGNDENVASERIITTAERYDPSKDEWAFIRQLRSRRLKPEAIVVDGKIHVFGGMDGRYENLKSIEVYDPELDSWATSCGEIEVPLLAAVLTI